MTESLHYMVPDSEQTLADALAEFRAAMPELLDADALAGEARELFHNHDIAHVVFGCDTSLVHEAQVDVWTIFGTTVGLRAYVQYLKLDETKQLLSELGIARTLWHSVMGLPRLLRVAYRARRMAKKWPWTDHAAYMSRTLADIRAEFGIAVLPA